MREGCGVGEGGACGCDSSVGRGGRVLGGRGKEMCWVGGEDGRWCGWRLGLGVGGDLRLGLGLSGYGRTGVFERRRGW